MWPELGALIMRFLDYMKACILVQVSGSNLDQLSSEWYMRGGSESTACSHPSLSACLKASWVSGGFLMSFFTSAFLTPVCAFKSPLLEGRSHCFRRAKTQRLSALCQALGCHSPHTSQPLVWEMGRKKTFIKLPVK